MKVVLLTTDPEFSTAKWNRLIPQVEIQLNLLMATRVDPKKSVYTYIFGHFDINDTSMAPPGTQILAHLNPAQRPTWVLHDEQGCTACPVTERHRLLFNNQNVKTGRHSKKNPL